MMRLLRPDATPSMASQPDRAGHPGASRATHALHPHSGIFWRSFRLHSAHYARETIAKICSPWSLRFAVRAPRKPGATIHGRPCDACVAPLATAIISQTGS
jgi:hypothetical protein